MASVRSVSFSDLQSVDFSVAESNPTGAAHWATNTKPPNASGHVSEVSPISKGTALPNHRVQLRREGRAPSGSPSRGANSSDPQGPSPFRVTRINRSAGLTIAEEICGPAGISLLSAKLRSHNKKPKRTSPYRKANGSIVVPQNVTNKPHNRQFVGEFLDSGPSTSVAPSATVVHLSEFYPIPARSITQEFMESHNNRFFVKNRKPTDRLRPGTPLWTTNAGVNRSKVDYPAEFIQAVQVSRPGSAASYLCEKQDSRLSNTLKSTVTDGHPRPASATKYAPAASAAKLCRALRTAQEEQMRLAEQRASFLELERNSQRNRSRPSTAGIAGRDHQHRLARTSQTSLEMSMGSNGQHGAARDKTADSDSDDDYFEREVKGLDEWVPQKTEIQEMASKVLLKYRTSKHRGAANEGFTVWDYAWERPLEKDARILAEMARFSVAAGASEKKSGEGGLLTPNSSFGVLTPTARQLTSLQMVPSAMVRSSSMKKMPFS
jgi:hypothetical protein